MNSKKKKQNPISVTEQRICLVANFLYFNKYVPLDDVRSLIDSLVDEYNLSKGHHPEIECARDLKNFLRGGETELQPHTQKFTDDFERLIAEFDVPNEVIERIINEIESFNFSMTMGNHFF
jgi:hypothetical protein